MDLGQAGVAGDFRQRNVFPLPEITLDEADSRPVPLGRCLSEADSEWPSTLG